MLTPANDKVPFVYKWAAPAVLIIVALIQILVAHTSELTPWKGGGFGMFAVIDASDMRILSVEGIDLDGNHCTVKVSFQGIGQEGPLVRGLGQRLYAKPDQELLFRVAKIILNVELIPAGLKKRHVLERLKESNPNLELDFSNLHTTAKQTYIVRRPQDPDFISNRSVKLKSIKLQMLRIRYDSYGNKIWTEPIGKPLLLGVLQ